MSEKSYVGPTSRFVPLRRLSRYDVCPTPTFVSSYVCPIRRLSLLRWSWNRKIYPKLRNNQNLYEILASRHRKKPPSRLIFNFHQKRKECGLFNNCTIVDNSVYKLIKSLFMTYLLNIVFGSWVKSEIAVLIVFSQQLFSNF